MREQRRLDYLQAIGITQWLPRQPLPHAPESRWLPPAANQPDHESIDRLSEQHHIPARVAAEILSLDDRSSSVASRATSMARDTQSTTDGVTETAESVSVSQALAETLQVPEFTLHWLWLTSTTLWVCDHTQDVRLFQAVAPRVLRALQQPLYTLQTPPSFTWPFIRSRQHDQSSAVAQQALMAQWQYFETQGVQRVITFGDTAQQWLTRVSAPICYRHDDIQQWAMEPQSKRALWHALRAQSAL